MSCIPDKKIREKYCITKDDSLLNHCVFKLVQETNIFKTVVPKFRRFDPKHLDLSFEFKDQFYNIDFTTTNYTKYDNDILFQDKNGCSSFFNQDSFWLNQQAFYLKSLSNYDIYTIKGYTFHGDNIVNYFIRKDTNNLLSFLKNCLESVQNDDYYFPLFYQFLIVLNEMYNKNKLDTYLNRFLEFEDIENFLSLSRHNKNNPIKLSNLYKEFQGKKQHFLRMFESKEFVLRFWCPIIEYTIKDLNRIIKRAPQTNKCFIAFRGSKSDYLYNLSSSNTTNDNTKHLLHTTFMSTSFDLEIATQFKENECCLMRILIPKGSSCLYVGGISKFTGELEVLFCNDSILSYIEPLYKQINLEDSKEFDSDVYKMICKNRSNVLVSFLVYKGYKI